ncbi:MAG TPA: AAA family ATPase [Gemmatimonadales bacterium]
MPLRPLYGHEAVRRRLATAAKAGRLPQALLLEGPEGVGKQRLALWLAQLLLCERGGEEPCSDCRGCKMANSLTHPDLHWLVPLEPSKKGADAEKQVEVVAGALADEMAVRRDRPLYGPLPGMAVHSVAVVRHMLRHVALTPAIASRKVFIVGDAERLIPQRANPEAANALLKVLEEPPANTILILTASEPDSLLPTILSRVVRVRVNRVPDSVVTAFIHNELPESKVPASEADGCIGRVLAREQAVAPVREVAGAFQTSLRSAVDRYAFALRQAPFQARGGFTDMLDGLVDRLRAEVRRGGDTRRLAEAIALVLQAREQAQGNVNPQLLTAVLAGDLADQWPT